MVVTFLGTGTSFGVPRLGCSCKVCTSSDPRDFRNRSSIFIEGEQGECLLVDAGPEFRLQALKAGIHKLDAVFITHVHADHIHGLDDVRPFTREQPLPLYVSSEERGELLQKFDYVFRQRQQGGGLPKLTLNVMLEPVVIGGITVNALPVLHGNRPILGYRFNNVAYITDCSEIPLSTLELCKGIDILIVDGLRQRSHPTHFTIDQALGVASLLRPKQCCLTHLCHDFLHTELESYCNSLGLPFKAGPALDGLRLSC